MVNYSAYLDDDDDYYQYSDEERATPLLDISLDDRGCPTQGRSEYFVTMYNYRQDAAAEVVLQSILNKAFQLCRRQIERSWFDFASVIRRTDMVFILSRLHDPDDEDTEMTIGFALCTDKSARTMGQDNSLYIDTICTEPRRPSFPYPAGKALLNVIYDYAQSRDYSFLSLRAIANVVNYYRKLGFRFLKPGQTQEEEPIRSLAELNKNRTFSSPADANRQVMLERALLFSQEVDEEGIPTTNPRMFAETYKEDLGLDASPTDDEVNLMVSSLPEHVKQSNGSNGIYDLYFTLIKKGYANLENCPGITKRQFTRSEEVRPGVWKRWITCEEGGFLMMKPLQVTSQMDDTSLPIIECPSHRGGKRRYKRKTRRVKRQNKRRKSKSVKRAKSKQRRSHK